jgi:hypothetical protein
MPSVLRPVVFTVAANCAWCSASVCAAEIEPAICTSCAVTVTNRPALILPAMITEPSGDSEVRPLSTEATADSSTPCGVIMRSRSLADGVSTVSAPTFSTPEAPTTMPYGSAKTTWPPSVPSW